MIAPLAAALLLAARPGPGPGAAPAAQAPRPAPEQPRVSGVELRLPPGEPEGTLRELVGVEPGQPLARRDLRRAVQLLYGTGRFANVRAWTEPAGAGEVRLVVEGLPRRNAAQVRVVGGGRALGEERLRRAAGLSPGDELWPGRLEEAAARVRAALGRRGWPRARVAVTARGEPQAEVLVEVEEGAPRLVTALAVGGPGTPQGLAQGLATRPGAPLDLEALEADVRALRGRLRKDGYLRARVGAPAVSDDGEGARVELPVEPGPRFVVRFEGASVFSAAELRAVLRLEEEQALDATALQAAGARVRDLYVAHGYATARVTAAERPAGRSVALRFQVEEGRRYRLAAVEFSGSARDPRWLRARLDEALEELAPREKRGADAEAERLVRAAGSPSRVRSRAEPEPTAVWDPPVFAAAAQRLVDLLKADGCLDAALEGTRATLDDRTGLVRVEVRLHEGVQTRIAGVTFEGARAVPEEDLRREARLAVGDPLSFGAVEAGRAALLALYARRGFLYARVDDVEDLSPDRARAQVTLRVDEGPQVRVGQIAVSGARRTREAIVRDALALRPGDVYAPELAARSQAGLLRLGVFRSVNLRLAEADVPEETKDLTVELAERPYQTLAQGFGFSLANGPRATIELTRPNTFGRALELSARAKVNYPIPALRADTASLQAKPPLDRVEGRAELGLRDPLLSLFGFGSGARFTLVAERLHRPAYDLTRGSLGFGLDVPLAAPVTLQLQYELEVDEIHRSAAARTLTLADVQALRFPEGITTLQAVRPVLLVDQRDSAVHPRSGWFATASAEFARSVDSTFLFGLVRASENYQQLLKLSAGVTGYLPIGGTVLALSVRGGRIVLLGDGPDGAPQTAIAPKRFFLGGFSTMRGYGEDEMVPEDVRPGYLREVASCARSLSSLGCSPVARSLASGQTLISEGGQAFALAKAEWRFGVYKSLEGGVFADVGNLWLDPTRVSLDDLRVSVGAGLRFVTPIGPAALDFGLNTSHDPRLGERLVAPHFAIGLF